jgi:hypothetical protein
MRVEKVGLVVTALQAGATDDACGGILAAKHAPAKLLTELVIWLDAVMKDAK